MKKVTAIKVVATMTMGHPAKNHEHVIYKFKQEDVEWLRTSSPYNVISAELCEIDVVEDGDVVEMEVHRGGGYINDSSIHEGGQWTKKLAVMVIPKDHLNYRVAYAKFFDGDHQTTCCQADYRGFPDGPKTFVRKATSEEYTIASGLYGFRGHAYPITPLP